MWKQDGNHPWKWNSKSYFTTIKGLLFHDRALETTFYMLTRNAHLDKQLLNNKQRPGFHPAFIFVSVVCLSDAVSLNNHQPMRGGWWPMRGGWWPLVVSGSDRWIVSPGDGAQVGPAPAPSTTESGLSGDSGSPSVLLCHSLTTLSLTVKPETDDEMTPDLGNIESPPDQWCWPFKV